MRHRVSWCVVAAVLCIAAPLRAQRAWELEIGIRGGWSHLHLDQAGTNDIDFADVPGSGNVLNGLAGRAPLFAVIPVGGRFALSPELGIADLSAGFGGSNTSWETGVTLDYAFTGHLYAGAGATFSFIRAGASENAGGGYQAKAGYRIPLGRALRLRVEAFFNGRPQGNLLPEQTLYGVSLGASASLK